MIIKSNTPLSDNELRRVREVMQNYQFPLSKLQEIFPGVKLNMTDYTLWIGNPPWDLTQEITIP
jgi:hypothetical protein